MAKKLESPTSLTEFAPLGNEEKPGGSHFFNKLFGRSKTTKGSPDANDVEDNACDGKSSSASPSLSGLNPVIENPQENSLVQVEECSTPKELLKEEINNGRSVTNVIRRISGLLDRYNMVSNPLQTYKDSEFKQYWMPDSNCKECYECGDRFTTFRRRHHCRICGQIFCSRCCNQGIPGKLMGYAGDLRVCTYCCKVVLSYIQSLDTATELSGDVRAMQEDLAQKLLLTVPDQRLATPEIRVRRKSSTVGFREEDIARAKFTNYPDGLEFTGPMPDVPKSVIERRTVKQGNIFEPPILPNVVAPNPENQQESQDPLWVKEIQTVEMGTPSGGTDESMEILDQKVQRNNRLSSSSSTFYLDIDIKESRVTLSKPASSEVNQAGQPNCTAGNSVSPEIESSSPTVEPFTEQPLRNSVNEEFLKGALLGDKGNGQSSADVFVLYNSQTLQDSSEERISYDQLNNSFEKVERNLLHQLLSSDGLPLSWCDVILPIIHRVADTVRPDIKNDNDDMDIRQYVQIKKIPGGNKSECCIVRGVICTKNVAHKNMKQNLMNPTILLLSSAIVYQRVESKISSLDPILMQESEYLKNTIAKISVHKPHILLVEKTVSRIAQEMLRDLGITVALNMKPSVMERVARCTQAGIVSSIDAHLGRPQLGRCHQFKVQSFHLPSNKSKTLLVFDGCASNLGCTVLLRGGSYAELKKVKRILHFMIYVAYNWHLERSFLMDECALPPLQSSDLKLMLDSIESIETNSVKTELILSPEEKLKNCSEVKTKSAETVLRNSKILCSRMSSQATEEDNDKKSVKTFIEDGSDPLRLYLQNEDDSVFLEADMQLQVQTLPFLNDFRKALDDVVLCISPYTKVSLPYLETENGRNCQLRQFFAEELFWSEQFELQNGKREEIDNLSLNSFSSQTVDPFLPLDVVPAHPFVYTKITSSILDCQELQGLLANFRARGGRIRNSHLKVGMTNTLTQSTDSKSSTVNGRNIDKLNAEIGLHLEKKLDALSPCNHQRLAVLFCSYSAASSNAPNFCVSPWVVNMDFYGRNDITLGNFLERYCFRPSYKCPSLTCDISMTEHVRKFAHENGCVHIHLHKLDNVIPAAQNEILMWSWCQKCKETTPVVAMSQETWSFSFAKYLELRFHAGSYGRRGSNEGCTHPLHQDHYQYFVFKQLVVSFKYTAITMREVNLPPLSITTVDTPISLSDIVEEIKILAEKGYGIYSKILEYLCTLKAESQDTKHETLVVEMLDQQQVERSLFRERIEAIQLNLTSPALEKFSLATSSIRASSLKACTVMWKISDSLILLKKQIAEAIHNWNAKIQDFVSTKKKEEKVTKSGVLYSRALSSGGLLSTDSIPGHDALLSAKEVEELTTEATPEPAPTESGLTTQSTGGAGWKIGSVGSKVEQSIASIPEEEPSANTISQIATLTTDDVYSGTLAEIASDEPVFQEEERMQEEDSEMKDKLDVTIPEIAKKEDAQDALKLLQDLEIGKSDVSQDPTMTTSRSSSSLSSYNYGISPGIYNSVSSHTERIDDEAKTDKSGAEKKAESKGHERSKSDGAEKLMENRTPKFKMEDENAIKLEKKERGSMKNLISQLLSTSAITPIQSPFQASEHLLLTNSDKVPVVVYDNEPGSIIAYTLSSSEYEQQLQELKVHLSSVMNSQGHKEGTNFSSPTLKKRYQPKVQERASSIETLHSVGELSPIDFNDFALCSSQELEKSGSKAGNKSPSSHIEVQFSDATARFYCRVYFAEQFRKLRRLIFPDGEERYIRSLSRCIPWMARGGKSGLTFCKTHDDRFILKQMSRIEVPSFLDFAPYYFQYISRACSETKPTVLAKIVGVYRIGFKNTATNTASKLDLLVMENLFYGRNIIQRFDLKGSVRNRLVTTSDQEGDDIVLLDENLLKLTCDSPLYIRPHSKTILTSALHNDAHFLSSHSVMDYSLLVGLDDEKKEFVVGIIDYIRRFTWDKRLEMVVKSAGILGGHGKLPTVVSPELYQIRFCEAMDRYFLWVPDQWSGLGRGIEF